jgi:hypothetical protein
MKNRKDSVVLLWFGYHRNQNINNKETRQETKEAVDFFGLFTVKKKENNSRLPQTKRKSQNWRARCLLLLHGFTVFHASNCNESKQKSIPKTSLALPFVSCPLVSLLCPSGCEKTENTDGEPQERERWRAGQGRASFAHLLVILHRIC